MVENRQPITLRRLAIKKEELEERLKNLDTKGSTAVNIEVTRRILEKEYNTLLDTITNLGKELSIANITFLNTDTKIVGDINLVGVSEELARILTNHLLTQAGVTNFSIIQISIYPPGEILKKKY